MTVGEWLVSTESRLKLAGVESPRLEAQVLACHVLLVPKSSVLAHPEADFPDLAGETLVQRREGGEPLAYIVGTREFFGRSFRVGPGVLIPRQDTEILIETALELIDALTSDACRMLDIGVGSGAIAITLKLERTQLNVTGVDASSDALEIAQTNAEALGADVNLVLSDGFEAIPTQRFDIIVSNPPYIADSETLPREVREFEPEVALFAGPTGYEFYRRLATESPAHLEQHGRIVLEVGHTQAAEVVRIFEAAHLNHVRTVPDLAGIPRVVEFEFAGS